MIGTHWIGNLEKASIENPHFRTVLYTGPHTQLTVMSLAPGEEIGYEVHEDHDQFIWIGQGHGRIDLREPDEDFEQTVHVERNWGVVVPAGTRHNVVNLGPHDLKLFSIYAPPVHADTIVHRTKADAVAGDHATAGA